MVPHPEIRLTSTGTIKETGKLRNEEQTGSDTRKLGKDLTLTLSGNCKDNLTKEEKKTQLG